MMSVRHSGQTPPESGDQSSGTQSILLAVCLTTNSNQTHGLSCHCNAGFMTNRNVYNLYVYIPPMPLCKGPSVIKSCQRFEWHVLILR